MKINPEMIELGMYEKALPQSLSWAQRLAAARDANYDFVEMSIDDSDERIQRLEWGLTTRNKLKREIQESDMRIKSMSLSAHRRFPLGSENPKTSTIAVDILKKAIDFSVDLGIRYILIAGSDVYHEESNAKTQENFLANLEQGVIYAAQAGVMLALENWDIRIESISKVMHYVNYFNSPWFQAYVDVGNLVYAEKDVLAEMEFARGHLAAVHVKDTKPGQLRFVTPGEGDVPFVPVFEKLADLDFVGSIVLELWTADLPNAMDIVKSSNVWIREKMREGWLK
ncbi:MAG: L-ribulose-5-phosphate 3-epimerase [Anaerolineaceae bacterium]|nr:L-ribulose-5-phosphate 3-epimerase [Anaerolineaceae bacterium]